jgi:hypothetical protein
LWENARTTLDRKQQWFHVTAMKAWIPDCWVVDDMITSWTNVKSISEETSASIALIESTTQLMFRVSGCAGDIPLCTRAVTITRHLVTRDLYCTRFRWCELHSEYSRHPCSAQERKTAYSRLSITKHNHSHYPMPLGLPRNCL